VATVDLSGRWRAQPADERLRREFSRPDLDDEGWPEISVPGHWRSTPGFAREDGPLLYRQRFETPPTDGRRRWLVLDGLFYLGDVWLDGSYVGDTEGYFFPHAFEVTELLHQRSEHLLAVEAACSQPSDRAAKRNLTGVFQHWDCLDPDWNPGGIWRPVRIEDSGPVRITRLVTLCPDATNERAVLNLRATLDAAATTRVVLRTTVGDTEHEIEQPLAAGENQVTWNVTVEHPRLWWPHSLGDQPLEDVTVDVVDRDGTTSDVRRFRTGLRQVSMSKWVLSVNGERLFLKGSNQGPTRMALGEATADDLARDVSLAKDAGLDLLRVHAHISRPELYDAADEAGLLLWQDLPLQWGYARGVRKQAVRQAGEAVQMLGHHPSVAIWCGHNEPMALDIEPGVAFSRTKIAARAAVAQELPSWNKTVLDHSIKRALEQGDGSRPVIAHSGVFPHPGSGGTDTHTYFGWYHGEEREFPRAMAAWPRLARFVSEFGAQAVPETNEFMEPERWPDLDWDRLWRTHALQRFAFDRYVPPADYATFDEWRRATQQYQATVVKHHVETLRRLKYRPTGGFCQFAFADAHPSVTWSVLDHERVPKAGFDALRDACRPVIVVADRPKAQYAPGEALALDVHVVNDLRKPVRGQVRAQLQWTGGAQQWRWEGEVPEDDCVRVGTMQAVVPDAPGPLTVALALVGDVAVANRYDAEIRSSDA
jgi:beta-mannosidase